MSFHFQNYKPIFEKILDLKTDEDLTFYEKEFLKEFLSQFKKPPKLGGFDEFCYTAVKESNYQKFFHDLLYVEEYENVNSMSHYNMTEVKMLSCEDEREVILLIGYRFLKAEPSKGCNPNYFTSF